MYKLSYVTPDSAYRHFSTVNIQKLERHAQECSQKTVNADSPQKLKEILPQFMVFLLACTYPRLSQPVQETVKEATKQIESKHGPIAKLLELDPKDVKALGHDFMM